MQPERRNRIYILLYLERGPGAIDQHSSLNAWRRSKSPGENKMASRFSKKPDPSIQKNVQKARAEAHKRRNAHASVVVTSIAATLFSWALFSNQDAVALEAARAAQANTQQAVVS